MFKVLSSRFPTLYFVCCFLLVYLFLLLPWPGWNAACGSYLREIGRIVFGEQRGDWLLDFQSSDTPGQSTGWTRIVLGNRTLLHPDGSGPSQNIDLDARQFLWKPMALVLALSIAMPRRKRLLPTLLAGAFLQCYICLCLGIFISLRGSDLALITLTPLWKRLLDSSETMLVAQLSFGAPLLIWALLSFRDRNLATAMTTLLRQSRAEKRNG
jgi:hypothetical protein